MTGNQKIKLLHSLEVSDDTTAWKAFAKYLLIGVAFTAVGAMMIRDGQYLGGWLVFLFGGFCTVSIGHALISTPKWYTPGLKVRAIREQSTYLGRDRYRTGFLVCIALAALFFVLGMLADTQMLVRLWIASLSLAATAGLFRQLGYRVVHHRDVDVAANALGREQGVAVLDQIRASFHRPEGGKQSEAVAIVTPSSMQFAVRTGDSWDVATGSMASLNAIGFGYSKDGLTVIMETRFTDGTRVRFGMPLGESASDPVEFGRAVLNALDEYLLGGGTAPSRASRRRIATTDTDVGDSEILGVISDVPVLTSRVRQLEL